MADGPFGSRGKREMTRDTSTTRQGPRASVDTRTAASGTRGASDHRTGPDRVGDRLAHYLARVRIERALLPTLGAVFVTVVAVLQCAVQNFGAKASLTPFCTLFSHADSRNDERSGRLSSSPASTETLRVNG
jgi:hypothetical protein